MLHETPQERRRRAQSERILDAALALVADEGVEALSMHGVAAAVDLTPGALYRYHRSKEALIGALAARVAGELAAALAVAVPADLPPLRRAVVAARTLRDLGLADAHRSALVARLLGHPRLLVPDPADAEAGLAAARRVVAPLAGAFHEAAAAGALAPGPADRRAGVVLALIVGSLQLGKQRERLPALVDPVALVDEGLAALLAGWGAPPAALASALDVGGERCRS